MPEYTLLPVASVTRQRTCISSHELFAVAVVEAVVLPFHNVHEPPAFLKYHWYFKPVPVALTVKVVFLPAETTTFCELAVILSCAAMVTVAADEVVLPLLSVTTQRTCILFHVSLDVAVVVAVV